MSRAKSDVERSRQTLDEELEKLRKELEDERNSAGPQIIQVAPGPVGELVTELNAQIDRLFEARRKQKQAELPEAAEDLRQVEAVVRRLVSRVVAEREQPEPPAGSLERENSILQRRLEKMGEYVASLESALKTLSNAKAQSNQQIQNVLRQLGLANEDKYLEKKKEALKVVLDVNRFIRKEAKQLDAKGVTLATPGGSYVEPSFDAKSAEALAAGKPVELSVDAPPAEPPPKVKVPAATPAEEVREAVPIAAATMEWSLDRSSA
jgi:chromosome segregation ATPase